VFYSVLPKLYQLHAFIVTFLIDETKAQGLPKHSQVAGGRARINTQWAVHTSQSGTSTGEEAGRAGCLEKRATCILEVAGGLKGFKQTRDLVRFLERSFGELGEVGWEGER
jgi:hypothetical protein